MKTFQIKWFFSIFLIFCSIISEPVKSEPLKFETKGNSALLINAESGAILYQYQSDLLCYPASTTKVATALYVLRYYSDKLDLPIEAEQESLAVATQEAKRRSPQNAPPYYLEPDGSHIGIKKGEILSLRELLKGMLIPSGNDAANVIAYALGPQIPKFMDGLNTYLKEIGCTHTTYYNPHGLHDGRHQTTAQDLALMTREALKYPLFCEIVSQKRFIRPKTNKQVAATFLQTNRLLRPGKYQYARAIGVKTGYHSKAKKTFIGAAHLDGRTLILVLLGHQDRNTLFQEAKELFEIAFNQPKVQRLYLKAGAQPFTLDLPLAERPLTTYLADHLNLDYYPAEDPEVKCFLYWEPVELPIAKNEKIAMLKLMTGNGEVIKETPLWAAEDVKLAWPHSWIAALPCCWYWIVFGMIGIVFVYYCFKKMRKDRK